MTVIDCDHISHPVTCPVRITGVTSTKCIDCEVYKKIVKPRELTAVFNWTYYTDPKEDSSIFRADDARMNTRGDLVVDGLNLYLVQVYTYEDSEERYTKQGQYIIFAKSEKDAEDVVYSECRWVFGLSEKKYRVEAFKHIVHFDGDYAVARDVGCGAYKDPVAYYSQINEEQTYHRMPNGTVHIVHAHMNHYRQTYLCGRDIDDNHAVVKRGQVKIGRDLCKRCAALYKDKKIWHNERLKMKEDMINSH